MSDIEHEHILKNINAALKNRKLYPAGHPAITTAANRAVQFSMAAFKTKSNFIIALVNDALVFEADIIADSETMYPDIIKYMAEKAVNAIIIEKGVSENEMTAFFDILAGPAVTGQELQKTLHAKGIVHMTLKSVQMGKKNMLAIYNGARETVKNVMQEIRMGKLPKSESVSAAVDDITESVLSDQNAVIGLTMIKNYDNYLYNHCVNVSIMSLSLGKALNLDKDELHAVGVAALLHDIGKTGVSEDIIRKPGGLSSEEWEKLKEHPQLGSNIIHRMEKMVDLVARLVFEHHIRYDHSGYPQTTSTLHPFSQILTICDAYDALTTLRVYQKPHSPVEAVKIMNNLSGKHFNPDTLKRFINMIGVYPVGTIVRLSSGELAIVMKVNPDATFSPFVKIVCDSEGANITDPVDTDLAAEDARGRTIISAVNPATVSINLADFFEKEASQKEVITQH
ncbi:MAG: HD-GYP domain-containing protein [Deltaproteobacteria bacterium]|nr:HD-GYP domain-containing protein [Deltaproteobacteria bacterium]